MPLPKPIRFLDSFRTLIFVETGSHRGDGIQEALDTGCFDAIYSCDISPFAFGWCSHRFEKLNNRVYLYLNDSRAFLKEVLPSITTKITFWLDAHECGTDRGPGTESGSEDDVPLLEELQLIRKHEIKHHNILIDDVRLFGEGAYPKKETIVAAIKRINPKYEIVYYDSPDFPGDILVATAPTPT